MITTPKAIFATLICLGLLVLAGCGDLHATRSDQTGSGQKVSSISVDEAAVRCNDLMNEIGRDPESVLVDMGVWNQAKSELELGDVSWSSDWNHLADSEPVIFCTVSGFSGESPGETVNCPDGRILSLQTSMQSRYIVRVSGRPMWIGLPSRRVSSDSSATLCSDLGESP